MNNEMNKSWLLMVSGNLKRLPQINRSLNLLNSDNEHIYWNILTDADLTRRTKNIHSTYNPSRIEFSDSYSALLTKLNQTQTGLL